MLVTATLLFSYHSEHLRSFYFIYNNFFMAQKHFAENLILIFIVGLLLKKLKFFVKSLKISKSK